MQFVCIPFVLVCLLTLCLVKTILGHYTVIKHDLVISMFMESMDDWMYDRPYDSFNIICYNKGTNDKYYENIQIIKRPNVGRESETYLRHIVNNYDKLAPVTVFLPGSFYSKPFKKHRAEATIELVLKTGNTVFYGDFVEPDIRTAFADFIIEDYQSSNAKNRDANPENQLVPATRRPFGRWYNYHFGGLTGIKIVCYTGIFAVSNQHIRQHPIEYYNRLLEELTTSSSPEVGHYFERAWAAIFYPYPDSCVYKAREMGKRSVSVSL